MPKKSRPRPPNKRRKASAAPDWGPRPLQKAGAAVYPHLDDTAGIVEFLKQFQMLADPRAKLPSKLISIKMPEPLLAAFRFRCDREGIAYQTMIKRLMHEWLAKHL